MLYKIPEFYGGDSHLAIPGVNMSKDPSEITDKRAKVRCAKEWKLRRL